MSELYYAEMEAARNAAEDDYFKARPKLMRSTMEEMLFRAGFERAFQLLWNQRSTDEKGELDALRYRWLMQHHGEAIRKAIDPDKQGDVVRVTDRETASNG